MKHEYPKDFKFGKRLLSEGSIESRSSSFVSYNGNFFDPPMPVSTFAKDILATKGKHTANEK